MADSKMSGPGFAATTSPADTDYLAGYSPGVGNIRVPWSSVKVAASVPPVAIQVAISDEATAITTGTAKITFRAPYAFTLTGVRASLSTASSSGAPVFDINMGGTSVLSTKLSIDASEKTSTTAATPPVISTSAITSDAEITVDVDTAGTGAKGAKITLIGTYP